MPARNIRRLIYPLLLIGAVTSAMPVNLLASNSTIDISANNIQVDDSEVTSIIEILDSVTPTTPTATTPTTLVATTSTTLAAITPTTLVAITSPTHTAIGNITLQHGNVNTTNNNATDEEPSIPGSLSGGEISIKKGGGGAGGRGSSSPSSGGGGRGSSSSSGGGSSGGGSVNKGNSAWFPLAGGLLLWPSVKSAACAVDGAAIMTRAMTLASATALMVLCAL
ncbi:hypothetical protein F5B18DRAFT_650461 [Nemania serpens]|nr:hypothetical protein F5B18DRAFT_650461 [Nemania serpens]